LQGLIRTEILDIHSLGTTFIILAMRFSVSTVALLATVANGSVLSWTEPVSGVQYSVGIPEVAAAPFDIYTSIVAPIDVTWAAVAYGGCMLRSPLLVAWPHDTNVVVSPRWAT
jgi:cellobiose dehydrogenase (acceptor)